MKQARDQLQLLQDYLQVEVQYNMADTCQNLLLEVTALRSKVAELRLSLDQQEKLVREKVKAEYSSLVKDIFDVCRHVQKQFSEYRFVLCRHVF